MKQIIQRTSGVQKDMPKPGFVSSQTESLELVEVLHGFSKAETQAQTTSICSNCPKSMCAVQKFWHVPDEKAKQRTHSRNVGMLENSQTNYLNARSCPKLMCAVQEL